MKVIGLWRYPVKSLRGERLDSASVQSTGVAGDRIWGLRDLTTGRILTARRRPELLHASAAYEGDIPVITLPDGQRVGGSSPASDAVLSAWLDGPVSLVTSAAAEGGRAEYFEDATDDSSRAIEFTMPIGRFVDAAHLLVLTTASLRHGESLYAQGTWDPRRFRPNVLVEAEGEGFLEDSWVGRTVAIGSTARVAPARPCPRCTMVTREQPGGISADADIFRTLAKANRGNFGVSSEVVVPGEISVGDSVSVDD